MLFVPMAIVQVPIAEVPSAIMEIRVRSPEALRLLQGRFQKAAVQLRLDPGLTAPLPALPGSGQPAVDWRLETMEGHPLGEGDLSPLGLADLQQRISDPIAQAEVISLVDLCLRYPNRADFPMALLMHLLGRHSTLEGSRLAQPLAAWTLQRVIQQHQLPRLPKAFKQLAFKPAFWRNPELSQAALTYQQQLASAFFAAPHRRLLEVLWCSTVDWSSPKLALRALRQAAASFSAAPPLWPSLELLMDLEQLPASAQLQRQMWDLSWEHIQAGPLWGSPWRHRADDRFRALNTWRTLYSRFLQHHGKPGEKEAFERDWQLGSAGSSREAAPSGFPPNPRTAPHDEPGLCLIVREGLGISRFPPGLVAVASTPKQDPTRKLPEGKDWVLTEGQRIWADGHGPISGQWIKTFFQKEGIPSLKEELERQTKAGPLDVSTLQIYLGLLVQEALFLGRTQDGKMAPLQADPGNSEQAEEPYAEWARLLLRIRDVSPEFYADEHLASFGLPTEALENSQVRALVQAWQEDLVSRLRENPDQDLWSPLVATDRKLGTDRIYELTDAFLGGPLVPPRFRALKELPGVAQAYYFAVEKKHLLRIKAYQPMVAPPSSKRFGGGMERLSSSH